MANSAMRSTLAPLFAVLLVATIGAADPAAAQGFGGMARGGNGGMGGGGMGGGGMRGGGGMGGGGGGLMPGLMIPLPGGGGGGFVGGGPPPGPPQGGPPPSASRGNPRNNNRGTGGGGGGGGGGGAAQAQANQNFVPNEVVTAFAPGTTPQAINAVAQRYGLTQLETQNFALIGVTLYRWRISPRATVPNVVSALGGERTVASVQPNFLFALQEDAAKAPPSAPAGALGNSAQYVLDKLQVGEAQQIATGRTVRVAVIDSRIDGKLAELDGSIAKSFDAVTGNDKPHPHGTSIAGAIVSHGRLTGIAPGAELFAVVAFDDSPGVAKGTSFAIYKGLQWAADNGVRVVNMSFAGPADQLLQKMLAAAYGKGMVLIAAAGNAGPQSPPLYPAADPDVIAVTATDKDDRLFPGANRGRYLAVAAPGVDIIALAPDGKIQFSTGTSIAAAHVSGIAALMLEYDPSLKPSDIRAALIATARQIGPPKPDSDFGAGLVSAVRALNWLDHKPTEPAAAAAAAAPAKQ
jgi:Subtilase family